MARRSLVRGGGHSEDRPRFHSEPRAGGGTIQERKLSKTDRADERYELALLMPSNSVSCQCLREDFREAHLSQFPRCRSVCLNNRKSRHVVHHSAAASRVAAEPGDGVRPMRPGAAVAGGAKQVSGE